MTKLLLSFFLFGLSLGLGSCITSCGPLLISYVAGTGKDVKGAVWAYLVFSLSRLAVYLALGISVFYFGQFLVNHLLDSWSRYIFIIGGAAIIITGFLLILDKDPHNAACKKARDFLFRKDTKNIALFGLLMGIIPCLPLISVLSYIALSAKTWATALACSFSFGLGTIFSPLFILVVGAGCIPYTGKQTGMLKIIGGLIIIFLGLQLFLKGW